ncbi:MAG: DUF1559 domain-containing protein [Pirellulaceae bacterium]
MIRFRIVHLLYATGLIGSALATFGTGGILPAVILCVAWGWAFASESRPRAFPEAFLIVLLIGCLYGVFGPAFSASRGRVRRMDCTNNLKQIALALHDYHDIFKTFPPAYIADDNGRPMHSWRVLILPFLEQQPLYDAYYFDEPWDGPNNRQLLSKISSVYSCASQRRLGTNSDFHTNYVVVIGEETVWRGEQRDSIRHVTDSTADTLLVCEVLDRSIPWMEPTDIRYADAIKLLTSRDPHRHSGHIYRSFFYEWSPGRNIALADGSVKFIARGIEVDDAKRLLTANDGEPLDVNEIRGTILDTRRLRLGNCMRLGMFVLLALWPLPWVWIHPHGTSGGTPPGEGALPEETERPIA